MSIETDWTIDEVRKSIDKLNENVLMIAYQLYVYNAIQQGVEQYANESLISKKLPKTFFSELKNLENAKEQEE